MREKIDNSDWKILSSHKISLSDIFDATGTSKSSAYAKMKEIGKNFAVNTPACSTCGNTARTRKWHCIECNRAAVGFQKKSASINSTIYIAGSVKQRLLKVGVSGDVDKRISDLNRLCYGGASDWRSLAVWFSPEAPKCERFIHAALEKFSIPGSYVQGGQTHACYELFKCNFSVAYSKLRTFSKGKARLVGIKEAAIGRAFEFEKR